MFLDINQDGKVDLNEVLALLEDPKLVKPLGTLLGYGMRGANESVLPAIIDLLKHANEAVAQEPSARLYIEAAIEVGEGIIERISDENDKRIARASLAGAKAFVDALEWEDGIDAFEIITAFSALTGPIMGAFLRR